MYYLAVNGIIYSLKWSTKMKIDELLKESEFNFDSKNITNKGHGIVSSEIIDQIENFGITSELLDKFPFPIFKYRTQITLHGKFDKSIPITYNSTGGYKNLIVNKNQSLGVRYSAIDIHKKKLIGRILRLEKSRFSLSLDSQSCYLLSYLHYSEENVKTMKQVFSILPKNYIGFSQLYVSASLYGKFIVIKLVLNAIYGHELYPFLAALLQKDYSEQIYNTNLAIKENEDQIRRQEYEIQSKKEREQKEAIFGKAREEFIKLHSVKFIHSLSEGRYLFFDTNYSDEFQIKVLHIFRNKNKMLMNYSENVNDLSNIPLTDLQHRDRKQLKEHRLKRVQERLQKDFYFKLVA